jgi:hypothetical protein
LHDDSIGADDGSTSQGFWLHDDSIGADDGSTSQGFWLHDDSIGADDVIIAGSSTPLPKTLVTPSVVSSLERT